MSITEQYALDTWRLGSQQQAPPPAPGSHEAKLLWAWWVARKEARDQLGPTARGTGTRTPRRRARRA
ncbi:hypothetical protein [Streptomyces sp. B15]|uniref:hypothetical protein n=1 Tax=Streptomyces sp. B15 TaxID=1537797 RepID=UPI001B3823E2|nr:hypothetical protein [Streptomyces sp. B15]MBQ1124353.1 hypothetical protein [Streptomyces sp. B15]